MLLITIKQISNKIKSHVSHVWFTFYFFLNRAGKEYKYKWSLENQGERGQVFKDTEDAKSSQEMEVLQPGAEMLNSRVKEETGLEMYQGGLDGLDEARCQGPAEGHTLFQTSHLISNVLHKKILCKT